MKIFTCLLITCLTSLYSLDTHAQTVGSIDRDFGEDGFAALDMGRSKNNVQRMAVRPDGKILLAGGERNEVDGGFCVVRLGTKGKIDRSFGEYGKVIIPLEGELRDIHLLNSGKILLAGYINKGPDKDFVVIRLNEDGSVDKSFADKGKKVVNLGGTDEGWAIAIQKDGSILIAGNTYAQSWMQRDFVVVKLHPEGNLDESFGNGGIKRIDIDKYGRFQRYGVATQW